MIRTNYGVFIGASLYFALAPKTLLAKMTISRITMANKIHCIKPEGKKPVDPKMAVAARLLAFEFVLEGFAVFPV